LNATKSDLEKCAKLLGAAARAEHWPSQRDLGRSYHGGLGVEKDPKEAIRWFLLAAECDEPSALKNLGYMYERGTGVPADEAKGLEFLLRAVDEGDVESMRGASAILTRGEQWAKAENLLRKRSELLPERSFEWFMWLPRAAPRRQGGRTRARERSSCRRISSPPAPTSGGSSTDSSSRPRSTRGSLRMPARSSTPTPMRSPDCTSRSRPTMPTSASRSSTRSPRSARSKASDGTSHEAFLASRSPSRRLSEAMEPSICALSPRYVMRPPGSSRSGSTTHGSAPRAARRRRRRKAGLRAVRCVEASDVQPGPRHGRHRAAVDPVEVSAPLDLPDRK